MSPFVLCRRVLTAALAFTTVVAPAPARGQTAMDELRRVISTLPDNLFDLTDLDVTTAGGTVTASASATLLGSRADVLFSFSTERGNRSYVVGFRPDDWSLAKALPDLALPALDGLRLDNVVLVVSTDSITRSSEEMASGEYDFYAGMLGEDSFTLELRPGINLIASIPVDKLPDDHPLLKIMDALGIEHGVVRLQGTLGKSLTMLAQPGAGGAAALKDLYLRAELPPMRPKGSPEWFRQGQLALEITGDPSIRLAGEMTVRIQQDELEFFLAAALARTGVSLSGGLKADRGWEQPFGIGWLTLYKVVLKISVTTAGSVQLGFGADMVIGEKDMSIAVSIAISPAGVPTNFIFAGESEAGFGLSDLATMQEKMSAAREAARAATGAPASPIANLRLPIEVLPDVEFRNVGLKFAPKPDPDLGVERGMAIKGRLLLPTGPGGGLADIAAVEVNVGEDGIWVRGNIPAYSIGPLTWQDAMIDLTATREDQHLRLAGDVQLLSARQKVDLDIDRTHLRFTTVSEMYGLFHAEIDANAAFDLRQPKFRVHALAQSDLGGALQPIVRQGATAFVNVSGVVIQQADIAIAGLRVALARADATVEELRDALERQRALARARVDAVQAQANQIAGEVGAARARRDRARQLWEGTSIRQISLKASRRNDWLRAAAQYTTVAARYAAQLATVAAATRVLDALPPVDQSIAVLAAEAAARVVRTQMETAQRRLEQLRQAHDTLVTALAQGGTLFAINLAEVTADLEMLRAGRALEWRVAGVFANQPFDLSATVDFTEPAAAAGALLSRLIQQ